MMEILTEMLMFRKNRGNSLKNGVEKQENIEYTSGLLQWVTEIMFSYADSPRTISS